MRVETMIIFVLFGLKIKSVRSKETREKIKKEWNLEVALTPFPACSGFLLRKMP